MLEIKRLNNEVFVVDSPIVFLGEEEINFLTQKAMQNLRRRSRICAHRTSDDPLHEMIIVIASDSYIRPHKHLAKSESFHIIEGLVDIIIFDNDGSITDVISLGNRESGLNFYYRLSDSRFHTMLIHTDILVIHEVTNGPFDKAKTKLASFAPSEENKIAVSDYMEHLLKEVAIFKAMKQ